MSLINGTTKCFLRGFKTTPIMRQPRSLVKLKKLQSDFQCDNGKPVWLKGGFCDRILYSTTVILCYIGLLMNLATIYKYAKPTSWRTDVC